MAEAQSTQNEEKGPGAESSERLWFPPWILYICPPPQQERKRNSYNGRLGGMGEMVHELTFAPVSPDD